jgi:ribosome biogenesis GTPase / thiamine phosphate phosphatase
MRRSIKQSRTLEGIVMKLEDLGYNSEFENYRIAEELDSFEVGRIISEHKERYILKNDKNEFEAELIGNLRFTARDRSDFPAVGDWVAFSEYDEDKGLIHAIFPRKTMIERQAVGKYGEKQIIATNIDFAFILQAVDRDFNLNRIERYLTMCNAAKVEPIIVLNKIDLIDESQLNDILQEVKQRIMQFPIIAMSNESGTGIEEIRSHIFAGKTYCLLGSSGVGKSTLLNHISGKDLMKTNTIGEGTQRGKHVTSHRELVVLDSGGILIDNPGMRELGIADAAAGLEMTFDSIFNLSQSCKYKDCTHTHEKGCAVILAIENGEIESAAYENFLKMGKEKDYFESTQEEKKKKDKDLGKIIKHFKKERKQGKY